MTGQEDSMPGSSEKAAIGPQDAKGFDAIIIGAGISGMYQLYRLRKLGLKVKVYEAGDGVGGTWYWNRYPGARFDSESYSYGYSFSEELLQEWEWQEHFSAQPETLNYLNYVAEKFDLLKDIEFRTRITSATYDEESNCWQVSTDDHVLSHARFLVTAVGPISVPTMPNIEGLDDFKGPSHHTGEWPHEPVDFTGKRVGVIGTGATAVQLIPEVAKTAAHLTVFQRRPNYCAPLHNAPIDKETQKKIKQSYPEIFQKCSESHGNFLHKADSRCALTVTVEERESFYEKLYSEPGFGIWMGNFRDVLVDEEANDTLSEFIIRKIRERVNDPGVAEKLIPRDHGFGTRRVPLETNYYEVYNQDNVLLVNIRDTPIEKITTSGIRTSDTEHELDIIIYATGFDAITGAFDRIDIRGVNGQTLGDKWKEGPQTYLGLQSAGFPNLLTLVGPHNAATFCNIPRCIEQNVDWVTGLIQYMLNNSYDRVVPTEEAEETWTTHVHETAEGMLFAKVDSWFMGVNKNLPHKLKRKFLLYAGGAPAYKEKCDNVAANDYEGFSLTREAERVPTSPANC
jgi:cation diffusion facilitator CzcD-associated flavoprotein CzcO